MRERDVQWGLQWMAPIPDDLTAALQRAMSRGPVDQEVLADDRLIETIRAGRLTPADLASPVVRLLAAWRAEVGAAT